MFNMLKKTFLHIFDVEVLFNLCAKSNFYSQFHKMTLGRLSCWTDVSAIHELARVSVMCRCQSSGTGSKKFSGEHKSFLEYSPYSLCKIPL